MQYNVWGNTQHDGIDGLVQERRNSSALTMELRLSCIIPSILSHKKFLAYLVHSQAIYYKT